MLWVMVSKWCTPLSLLVSFSLLSESTWNYSVQCHKRSTSRYSKCCQTFRCILSLVFQPLLKPLEFPSIFIIPKYSLRMQRSPCYLFMTCSLTFMKKLDYADRLQSKRKQEPPPECGGEFLVLVRSPMAARAEVMSQTESSSEPSLWKLNCNRFSTTGAQLYRQTWSWDFSHGL